MCQVYCSSQHSENIANTIISRKSLFAMIASALRRLAMCLGEEIWGDAVQSDLAKRRGQIREMH
jgi:hypothetical protein